LPARRLAGLLALAAVLACLTLGMSIRLADPPPNPAAARSRLNGKLVVGIDPSYPPFASINGNQQLSGFDVDFATELATRLGAKAEFVGMDVGVIFEALMQRKFDVVISASPPYPEYSGDLIYSQGYFNAGQVIVVPAGASGPERVSDLKGTVGVETGSAAEIEARRIAANQSGLTLTTYDSPASVLAAIKDGKVPFGLLDRVTALELLKTEPALKVSGQPITIEPYVVAARKEDSGLMLEIDAAINRMRSDKTLDGMEKNWLSAPSVPSVNPVNGQ
jgi:ABC-type amino acid transport substrate-binding protein